MSRRLRTRTLIYIISMLITLLVFQNLTITIPKSGENETSRPTDWRVPAQAVSTASRHHVILESAAKTRTQQRQSKQTTPQHAVVVHNNNNNGNEWTTSRWLSDTLMFASDTDNVTNFLTNSVLPSNASHIPCMQSPTFQIRLVVEQDSPSSKSSFWKIQTFDEDGHAKTTGGDVYFVTYTSEYDQIVHAKKPIKKDAQGPNHMGRHGGHAPTAVALVIDHDDGTYSLDFVGAPFLKKNRQQPTMNDQNKNTSTTLEDSGGGGILTIHLEFTCGIGRMARPTKDTWKTGGYLYPSFARLRLDTTSMAEPPPLPPPLRDYQHPNRDGHVDLSQYEHVVFWGDSLMEMFSGRRDGHWTFYHSNIVQFQDNDGEVIRSDLLETQGFESLQRQYGHVLKQATNSKDIIPKRIALVMGSAAWEMATNKGPYPGSDFSESLDMYRRMVQGVRQRYPNVTIFWKSPQAVHLTNTDFGTCISNPKCNDRIRYTSNAISRYLYEQQQQIMAKLKVPCLDIWEACYLSPHAHFFADFQHYHEHFNMLLLDMFYPPGKRLGPSEGYTDLKRLKTFAARSMMVE